MKRCRSRLNSFCDSGHNMDIERCQEELLRSRMKYNKLNQKYLELKVEYNKLEKDFRYNVRLMESIIKESNISALSEYLEGPKIEKTYNNFNKREKTTGNKDNEKIRQNGLSKTTLKILQEKSIYERLKIEIMNLREELREKESIIDDLKNNEKATKFRELDNKMAKMYEELNEVKARNQVLETMQVDYVNSKNQIIFLLKQIDLYKKDNKKLKELYDKILFDYQNITKQKELFANSRNLYEEKIKALVTRNNGLKIKIEDLRNRNLAYYEEIENFKNLNQSQIDRILIRKDKEISQYKGQITQLKIELSNLQKITDERNKNNINSSSSSITGYQKMKPIFVKKEIKEFRKTDSDFFTENPNNIIANDKKIVINSKNSKISDDNKNEKKIRIIKIKENKEENYSIKAESKNEINDISNNYYEQNIPIKEGRNINEKKTTVNDEDINIISKKEETVNNNKKEKPEIIKENNISQEINEDIKKEETNKENNINNVNKNNNSPKNKIIEKQIKNEEKAEKEENNKENEQNKKIEKEKTKEKEKEEEKININNKEISEDNKSKGTNNKKYNEEEIIMNTSKDKDKKSIKSKKNESSSGYNDFESNIDKPISVKEDNNSNRNININNNHNENNSVKDINIISIEPKNDLEKNNEQKLKESNIVDNEQKNESKENNNLNEEKNNKNDNKEMKDDNAIQDDLEGLLEENI